VEMVWGGSGVVRVSCGGWLFRTRQLSSFPVAFLWSLLFVRDTGRSDERSQRSKDGLP
jgi:hypothetical protein